MNCLEPDKKPWWPAALALERPLVASAAGESVQ